MSFNGYLWNWKAWIERLGLNQPEQPPLLNTIQPVVVMGDASKLTSNLYPAWGWVGGVQPIVAGRHSGFSIRSKARGGSLISNVHILKGAGPLHFSVRSDAHVFTAFTALVVEQMGLIDISADVKIGTTVAPALGVGNPTFNSNNLIVQKDSWFLAPGRELYFEIGTAAQAMDVAVAIMDFDSQEP